MTRVLRPTNPLPYTTGGSGRITSWKGEQSAVFEIRSFCQAWDLKKLAWSCKALYSLSPPHPQKFGEHNCLPCSYGWISLDIKVHSLSAPHRANIFWMLDLWTSRAVGITEPTRHAGRMDPMMKPIQPTHPPTSLWSGGGYNEVTMKTKLCDAIQCQQISLSHEACYLFTWEVVQTIRGTSVGFSELDATDTWRGCWSGSVGGTHELYVLPKLQKYKTYVRGDAIITQSIFPQILIGELCGAGIILWMHPASKRRRWIVTSSLIG